MKEYNTVLERLIKGSINRLYNKNIDFLDELKTNRASVDAWSKQGVSAKRLQEVSHALQVPAGALNPMLYKIVNSIDLAVPDEDVIDKVLPESEFKEYVLGRS